MIDIIDYGYGNLAYISNALISMNRFTSLKIVKEDSKFLQEI